MTLLAATLDDKYKLDQGRVYMNGIQALVRLTMMQRQRDRARGLNTACFVSGYRGSPLGGLDKAFWQASPFTEKSQIHFQPGINEDLAATAIWGTQQVNLYDDAKVDGVFSLWYGKGPGVDRSGDVFKHANNAGSSQYGGVLVAAGDDHTCKSSTLPHQSEYAFIDASIPILNPSNVQEILDLGIVGWELSRYSGCWIALKTIAEIVDSSASVQIDPDRLNIVIPDDFDMPEGGLNIRWPDPPMDQEERLHRHKLYAALAFARANRLNRIVLDSPNPRFGIITTGKSYLDVRQALEDIGIDDKHAAEIGMRIYKVGMPWPLERDGVREFATGLEEILVVEEKRAVIENQLKEQLYHWHPDARPRVLGKFDDNDEWILPSISEVTPGRIARVISDRIGRFYTSEYIKQRLEFLDAKERALSTLKPSVERKPYFCSGCPHNTSTKVPEGSRAMAGIGCHYMVLWMDRSTDTYTHMGGEGVPWVGQAPFTNTKHVFANLGDGTYFHSGLLAVRAAIAGKVNITYKILYNDAVAMTGGQPVDGSLSVPQISHQLYGEGVRRIAVVSDEPEKYTDRSVFAQGATIHHRDELEQIQRDFREAEGVTVIIYDQTCATEKRRRRKRGLMEDPAKRVVINELVCEGCGDCSVQSNCLSVVPVETEFGRKRAIDQSSCNKDFSCLKGFCPSFVTVYGGELRKPKSRQQEFDFPELPEPVLARTDTPYGIIVTGIGGTGVVTIGALLGMAAHMEGKGVSVLDMTGLAQKYGAVTSHVRIANNPEDIQSVRIAAGGANLLLGCDSVVASGFDALAKLDRDVSHAIINSHQSMTAQFINDPDMAFPQNAIERAIQDAVGRNKTHLLDATDLAQRLLGDSIASNLFMVGYAYQKGLIPLSADAIDRAIELNGVRIDFNRQAFLWGRRAAHDLKAVSKIAKPGDSPKKNVTTFESIVNRRVEILTSYQNKRYAKRYRKLIDKVTTAEHDKAQGMTGLAEAVARSYFKLMAYKDEYEVARLYTDGSFEKQIESMFEGDVSVSFNLAPPLFSKRDPVTGYLLKREYGPWMLKAFKLLATLKSLRGTPFDIFGHTGERKRERALIKDYEKLTNKLLNTLNHDNHALAVEIAELATQVRGYGHIKEESIRCYKERLAELIAMYENPEEAKQVA